MRVLFIGGSGLISAATTRLAIARGFDVYVLNRGLRSAAPDGARQLIADTRRTSEMRDALRGFDFEAVVDWIAFTPADIQRDLELFRGRVGQFVFISSASVYQKPPESHVVTESTALANPYWQYSRDKIACEARLRTAFAEEGFPATIVRPSMTYDTNLPVALGGWGSYTLAARLLAGRPIVVHGDGSSLWVVTHADDLARGLVGLLGNERARGEAFHITSDEVLTWNQIYATIAEELGAEPKIVHVASDFIAAAVPKRAGSLLGDKTWSVVFDNSKIKAFVPGFSARVPLRDGIRRTLEWFAEDERRRWIDAAADAEIDRILELYTCVAEEGA